MQGWPAGPLLSLLGRVWLSVPTGPHCVAGWEGCGVTSADHCLPSGGCQHHWVAGSQGSAVCDQQARLAALGDPSPLWGWVCTFVNERSSSRGWASFVPPVSAFSVVITRGAARGIYCIATRVLFTPFHAGSPQ